jgi:hypothetical protein
VRVTVPPRIDGVQGGSGTIEADVSPNGLETDVTAEALAARGWRVRPAAAFAVGEPRRAIRVTTSTLTPDQAAAFAADLKEETTACSPA